MEPGRHNVQNRPLVPKEKVLLPPLHIKLGVFGQFLKALKLEEDTSIMKYLQKKFTSLSEAKTKESVFVGPQIRKLVVNDELSEMLTDVQLAAWNSFKEICSGFLGKHRAEKHRVQRYCNSIGRKLWKFGLYHVSKGTLSWLAHWFLSRKAFGCVWWTRWTVSSGHSSNWKTI